jgi:hydroxymethylbilane synthase
VYIKSEGDIDTVTPLYELGVQGVFTKALDAALLSKRIDLAVHSMKDVPTQLAKGITQAAVLERASHKDIIVYKDNRDFLDDRDSRAIVGTSSIRRIAQWLHRYPNHQAENLRGNVNTRLRKLAESNWQGAIFAAAGLERIGLRPDNSLELDWMLPAPAQGAIMIVCRKDDTNAYLSCQPFNHGDTALCTRIERDFLRTLLGGCSTPISALAQVKDGQVILQGNITATDGTDAVNIERSAKWSAAADLGVIAAKEILASGGQAIADRIKQKGSIDAGI